MDLTLMIGKPLCFGGCSGSHRNTGSVPGMAEAGSDASPSRCQSLSRLSNSLTLMS